MHNNHTLPTAAPKVRRLLDQVRDAIRRKHYSYPTEDAHVFGIERYIYFSGKRVSEKRAGRVA